MNRVTRLLALAPLALASACASQVGTAGQAAAPTVAGAPPPPGTSAYGLFLAGQAAVENGREAEAAALFGRASEMDPANGLIGAEAFDAALLAGQVDRAAKLAPSGPDSPPEVRRLGLLARGVAAMAEGRGKEAHLLLSGPEAGPAVNPAAALVAPFAAAMAKDRQGAITRPVMTDDPVDQFQADLDQGEIFEHLGRYDEAETAFRSLIARGDPGELASLELGEMFERRGRAADAAEVYKEALARDPGETRISAALARVGTHGRAPPLASIRDEAARALLAPAAALILEKNDDGALACLRLSLRLDPDLDQGWVLVGDVMSEKGDVAAARTAYGTPGPKSPQYAEASGKLAWSYQNAGDKKTALATAQKAYLADPNSEVAAVNLADLERADGKDHDSVDVLDRLINKPGERRDWRLLYMRAAAYQEEGRWPAAERDLEAALKLAPDQPDLLNFLGYSWIDRGENLKQAVQMVQKAVDLDPQSGAMLDSLGWGYYRLGDYKTAVAKLEDAAALDAGDPDVNNHLGDAYWKVGRRAEAQFQWRRVLSLEPNAKLRSEIEIKLKSGPNDQMTPSDLDGS